MLLASLGGKSKKAVLLAEECQRKIALPSLATRVKSAQRQEV
jgi:hypothetical protein